MNHQRRPPKPTSVQVRPADVVHAVRAALGPARVPQAEVAVVGADLERDVHQLAVDPVVAPDGAPGRRPQGIAQVLGAEAAGPAALKRELPALPAAAIAAHYIYPASSSTVDTCLRGSPDIVADLDPKLTQDAVQIQGRQAARQRRQ